MIYAWVCGSVCIGLVVIACAGVGYLIVQDRRANAYTLRHGRPAIGWLVQANNALFEPGDQDLPALVLVSPDDRTAEDEAYMTDLAGRVMALKEVECDDEDDAFVSRLTTDELYRTGKVDRLPRSFTGSREVYAAHIFIYRDDLPGKRLRGPRVDCLIVWDEPGTLVRTRPKDDDGRADEYA